MRVIPFIIAVMALVLFIAPAFATDVTVPINKDYKYGDMVIHLLSVNITDYPMGNVYSPDPGNTVWPKLVFQYENTGTVAINGNLQIAFFDAQGNQYPPDKKIVDITMDPIQPGQKSDVRFVEAAVIPKDTKITSFKVYEDFKNTTYNINYGQAITPVPTPSSTTTGASPACCLAFLIPLLIVGIFVTSKLKR